MVEVARDVDVHIRLLRAWVFNAQRAEGGGAPPVRQAPKTPYERLRGENQRLKQALADKTLEVDFFKGALQKVEARRQPHSAAGETASTPRSGK